MNVQTYIQMKKIIFIASIFLMVAFGFESCKEEGRLDHIDGSVPAPGQIDITAVAETYGGAVIRYKVPNDANLMYVKAVYERNGEICETKASVYQDSLVIAGYGDTNPHEVLIYSVGRNEKESEPVKRTITPLTPPILLASAELKETFGGINMIFANPAKADLAFILLIDTLGGRWAPLQTFYSKAEAGRFARREMKAKETKVAVYIRDRWNNCSDTIVKLLTPMLEEKIPKDKFENAMLPGDYYIPAEDAWSVYGLQNLFDDVELRPGSGAYAYHFATGYAAPFPEHFTISLGRRVTLSRFKIFPRLSIQQAYIGPNPRTFEIWGTTNPPADGSFDNWTLLGRWEVFKPSGYNPDGTVGTITQEDINYFNAGQDFEMDEINFPDASMEITYLRFRTLTTFATHDSKAPSGQLVISEITWYGLVK
jgi:hypothetical protein